MCLTENIGNVVERKLDVSGNSVQLFALAENFKKGMPSRLTGTWYQVQEPTSPRKAVRQWRRASLLTCPAWSKHGPITSWMAHQPAALP